jgi:hypothetical protein
MGGLADGTVFVASPATGAVERRIKVFDGGTGAADGGVHRPLRAGLWTTDSRSGGAGS